MNTRVFLFVLALGAAPGVFAQALPELDLKATYAYNFAVLTQWPPATRASFNFCVYGDDGVAEAMRRLQGKSVHGRSVAVVLLWLVRYRHCAHLDAAIQKVQAARPQMVLPAATRQRIEQALRLPETETKTA